MERWGPWQEGQQAWSRLEDWYKDASMARAADAVADADADAGGGQRALRALEDSGLARRLLDQVEFEAVRIARRDGKSWAEIAVKLGVTRQSAWERWRDVDESPSSQPQPQGQGRGQQGYPGSGSERADLPDSERASIPGVIREEAIDAAVAAESERAARSWRRRSSVVVPNLIGMAFDVARKVVHEKGLVAEGPDPEGPPLGALGWPDGVVVDQSPESGAKVPPGSVVRLWVERGGGGGAGVREPRRPLPDPKSGQRMRDEVTDEAVSG